VNNTGRSVLLLGQSRVAETTRWDFLYLFME